MKDTALNLMMKTGAFAPFRLAHRNKALILCYHRFSPGDEPRRISATVFVENIRYLKKHYTLVPLSEIAARMQHRKPIGGLAAITIDDGYDDAYLYAFPILRYYNVPATVFVATDFVDRKAWIWTDKMRHIMLETNAENLLPREQLYGLPNQSKMNKYALGFAAAEQINKTLKTMPDDLKEQVIARHAHMHRVTLPAEPPKEFCAITWDQAREMDTHGVEIESHTVTHPMLTHVSDEQLRKELIDSRQRLEAELQRPVKSFCYPNGAYDERIRRAVAEAGYVCAVTTQHGFNRRKDDLLTLRRFHDEADQAHFVQTISGFENVKQRLRFAAASR